MPYIRPDLRPPLDDLTAPLLEHIRTLPVEEQDGALNYAVTRILHGLYPRRYFHMNRAMGVLSAITEEFYRRKVAPYEDEKIVENGDV
jgi:hypothetical protein